MARHVLVTKEGERKKKRKKKRKEKKECGKEYEREGLGKNKDTR